MKRLLEKIDITLVKKVVIAVFCVYLAVSNVILYARNATVQEPVIVYSERSLEDAAAEPSRQSPAPDIPDPAPAADETELSAGDGAESSYIEGRLNINTASLEELQTLKGIGPTKAQAIIEYREKYGGFTCPEEITEVKGIGGGTYEKIKGAICAE